MGNYSTADGKFKPVVNAGFKRVKRFALGDVNLAKANKLPLVKPVTTRFTGYVTQSRKRMFIQVAGKLTDQEHPPSGRPRQYLSKSIRICRSEKIKKSQEIKATFKRRTILIETT